MNMILYYSIKEKTHEVFDNLESAILVKPDFVIAMKSKGVHKSVFPQRTVEDEHFEILYLKNDGTKLTFEENGWKLLDLKDPMRYGYVISFKIVDPIGKVRIFDIDNLSCHFSNSFFNDIEDLIKLHYFFRALTKFESWDLVENEIFNKNYRQINTDIGLVKIQTGRLSKY